MVHLHNLRRWHRARGATLVLPVLLVPLAFAGLTAGPGYRIVSALDELEGERGLVADTERVRAENAQLRSIGEPELLRALAEELRTFVPEEMSKLAVYSQVRLAAERQGFMLRAMQISDLIDSGFGPQAQPIYLREIQIDGVATARSLVLFLDELRASGLPTAALDFTLTRVDDGPLFRVDLLIGVFHHGPERRTEMTAPTE